MIKGAIISKCKRYRYRLTRHWDADRRALPFVMLNPSTADADIDDPTIRRCIGFAKREGAGGIVVVNLFAFRATSPVDMFAEPERVGPHNEEHLTEVGATSVAVKMPIVCAWGAHGKATAQWAVDLFRRQGANLVCLGKTQNGNPRHPLYVVGTQALVPQ